MMDFAINSTFLNFRQNGNCLRKIGYILIFAVEQPLPRPSTAATINVTRQLALLQLVCLNRRHAAYVHNSCV